MNVPTHPARGMTLARCLACCGVLLAGGASVSAASAAVPDPNSFQVIDLPSDDGSAVLVLWARPDNEVQGVRYAVEIARSATDFESGGFKTEVVTSSAEALASAKPEYFGRSSQNDRRYFAEISPVELFPPPKWPKLTPERLNELAKAKVITQSELTWALSAAENTLAEDKLSAGEKTDRKWLEDFQGYMEIQDRLNELARTRVITDAELARARSVPWNTRPDAELSAAEKAKRKWFESFVGYIKTEDRKARDAQTAAINRATYYFRLAVLDGATKTYVERDGRPMVVSGSARANLFKWGKLNNLIFSLIFGAVVLAFIEVARRRPGLFIRKIAGLDAVDEAIGRSTEMDCPVFFVHGGGSDVGDTATIASISILSQVARRTAEHDSRVHVTNIDPIVTAVSQEVVQQAYTLAGRPDAYNPDDVALVATDQFSYVAAVSGAMVREQPGAIFFMGYFNAESLLLAETGASTGAIQVAGTDQYIQLPFFITTCDYTLIGEELYAASAYLSRDPRLLGSLRGQDVGKAFLMITIFGVSVAMTAAVVVGWDFTWLMDLFIAR